MTGETTTEEVPYEYYILNVKLTSKPISSVASELLTPEQLEMYQVYRQTLGNKPLIFGGGSPDTSNSEDLTGVVFVNGTPPGIRPWWTYPKVRWQCGRSALLELVRLQFPCGMVDACVLASCPVLYGQMGLSEPRYCRLPVPGYSVVPVSRTMGAGVDYANIAPGDAIFFDWDLDGSADHVGLVVGTDGSRVYTVEGNSATPARSRVFP